MTIRGSHDVIDQREIFVVRPVGIPVDERHLAIRVRHVEAVGLGKQHDLHGRESLRGTRLEIPVDLLTRRTVDQFPGGVGEVEEPAAGDCLEHAAVCADTQRLET